MIAGAHLTRRQLFQGSAAAAGLIVLGRLDSVRAAEASKWTLGEATPNLTSGPFYPLLNRPPHPGSDLTLASGARGQPLQIVGQVVNIKGKPVKGVQIEIWQANAGGRYSHPSDGNPAPLDPAFQGFGVATTDAEGRYRFRTVKPGGYPVIPGWWRAPHVHFQVTGRIDRYVTQMFFPDDPLNGQDRVYTVLTPHARDMVTCKLEHGSEPGATAALFQIVLANG